MKKIDKKVLVIGSSGFIGSHLFPRLEKLYSTFGYDLVGGNDIRDKFKLDRLFEKERFDIVINLAARAGVLSGEEFYDEYYSTNCVGLMNIIKICEKYKVKRFIHFSSSAVLKALSVYGVTKLAGDYMVKNSKLDWVIIRPFTVIGEGGRKDMVIGKWKRQLEKGEKIQFRGDGTTFRGYTYVGDLVDGVISAITGPGGEYDIGGDVKITLEEFWQIFQKVYPYAEREYVPLPEWDEPGELADTAKAREVLGWQPRVDIKSKIKELMK